MFARTLSMSLLVALAITGYPLLAATMSVLGVGDSRLPSILLRLAVVVLAGIALYHNRAQLGLRARLFTGAFAVFWIAYLGRIVHDGYIDGDMSDLYQPLEVLMLALVFALLPALGGFVGFTARSSRLAFTSLFALAAATAIVTLLDSREILLALSERQTVRYALEKLNPISVGNVGGTLLLLGLHGLFRRDGAKSALLGRAVFALAIGVGLFTLIIAASRGPVIATAVALLIYWLLPPRLDRLIVGGIIVAALGLGVSQIHGYMFKQFDIDVSTRYVEAAEGESGSIEEREFAYEGAFRQFMENPLFGDALFETETGGYPHNAVLESLMATGLVGGIAYLLCLAIGLFAAVRLMYRAEGQEWLGLLTVFAAVGAQFSGAHFTQDVHWITLVAAVATDALMRAGITDEPSSRRRRRRRQRSRGRRMPSPAAAV